MHQRPNLTSCSSFIRTQPTYTLLCYRFDLTELPSIFLRKCATWTSTVRSGRRNRIPRPFAKSFHGLGQARDALPGRGEGRILGTQVKGGMKRELRVWPDRWSGRRHEAALSHLIFFPPRRKMALTRATNSRGLNGLVR